MSQSMGNEERSCQWLAQHVLEEARTPAAKEFAAFWFLGLLNNIAYVIMLASAQEISSGAVGLVYLCAILPTLLVKFSGPYWFHLVSYRLRMWAIAGSMFVAYCIVAFGQTTGQQLTGVALVAFQGGLGEFSVLSMCSQTSDSKRTLTGWSSGTGFAGIAGYAWMVIMHSWLGLSFKTTLLSANIMPIAWLRIFAWLESQKQVKYMTLDCEEEQAGSAAGQQHSAAGGHSTAAPHTPHSHRRPHFALESAADTSLLLEFPGSSAHSHSTAATTPATTTPEPKLLEGEPGIGPETTAAQKLRYTLALWPYMLPLFLVYFAEYAMQSGTWSAMGFPVSSPTARAAFYSYANWCYQAGVFVSRSSGMLFQAGRRMLWAMPLMQCALLLFFVADAATHFWYNNGLLVVCFGTGLLGGAVYVNAFTLIAKEVAPGMVEFSLGAACVADSLGIALADAAAVLLQGCLYRVNGLQGAGFMC